MSASIRSILLPRDPYHVFVRVTTHATVEKRTEDYDDALGRYLARGASRLEAETKAARAIRPCEVLVGDYNAMVDNGIDLALVLLVGGGGAAFSNANARLGVGDSATAWATTQAHLAAATDKLRKGMNATYPVTGAKKQAFRSDFLTGEANWVWIEWGIFNPASGATMLSGKVEALGTKGSGTWTLSVDFSLGQAVAWKPRLEVSAIEPRKHGAQTLNASG